MAHGYVFGLIFLFLGETYSLPFPEYKQPRAKTQFGGILGLYKKSFSGHIYKSFEGIPFALPITHENRFKESVLYNKQYQGILNATTQAASCLHYSQYQKEHGEYTLKGDEDCLYLNIYIRDHDVYHSLKPVVIFFNPGGFSQTGTDGTSPEYLMDRDEILLITFNYRIGPLGFLSTGDSVVPGNMGLKDQIIAMRWVKENIKAFGGDPDKVTIMGLSAGGASVHYQMLSPLSKGLFHRAFSLSGSALCPWSLILDVPLQTKKLAALVGCPTESSDSMVECLRERPAHVIVRQMKHFKVWLFNPFTIFGPRVEETKAKNNFLPLHPADMLTFGRENTLKDVPWIVSVVAEDGLYPASEFVFKSQLFKDLEKNWNVIAPHLLFYNHSIAQNKHDNISAAVKKLYLDDIPISINTRKELIQMIGDRLFIAPSVNSANLVARKNKQPVYFYMYSHKNSVSLSKFLSGEDTVIGTAHGDDASLIMKFLGVDTKVSREDMEMSEILMKMLVTFADTGKVPEELLWERLPAHSTGFAYLNIRSKTDIKMIKNPNLGNKINISNIFKDDKSANVGGLPW